MSLRSTLVTCLAALVLFSCYDSNSDILERVDLFDLQLGKSENSMDVFLHDGIRSLRKNRFFMLNGLFYVANGNSSKIMKFSSYGDLLGLIYNAQENPRPVLLSQESNQKVSNKMAVSYAFENLGELAVLRNGEIIAEDQVPESQSVYDDSLKTNLEYLLIRFDQQGNYKDYLGQEGLGGSPFPYIVDVEPRSNNDIVVICRTPGPWLVYCFDESGRRKYLVQIAKENLPRPEDASLLPSVARILPDPLENRLFFFIRYYSQSEANQNFDEKIDPVIERLYVFNLETSQYSSWFELPEEDQTKGSDYSELNNAYQSLHEFVGLSEAGDLFFLNRRAKDQYKLSIFDPKGRLNYKSRLLIPDSELLELAYTVSSEGVLSSLMVFQDKVKLTWWRTDLLLGRKTQVSP